METQPPKSAELRAVCLPPPHASQSRALSLLGKSFPDGAFTASFLGVFSLCGPDVLLSVQLKSLLEWENSALGFRVEKG